MPPERLIALLAQLVADKELTEEQAAGILLHWREIAGLETILPLPVGEGVRREERDPQSFWLMLVGALDNYMLLLDVQDEATAWARLRRMGPQLRMASANRMQGIHAHEALDLARDLAAGRITVAEWQRKMRRLNTLMLDVLAVMGGSRPPSRALAGRLDEIELTQAAFLQRFADHLAGNLLTTALASTLGMSVKRWTTNFIAQRAATYSGPGRTLFFEACETADGGMGEGWVVRYVARDDRSTCSPCQRAEGYYLPGDGPYPGEVCLGGGACRCERWPVYDPAMYAQLAGLL